MARTDIHLDAMLRHLGAAYYESLHGRAAHSDVTRALATVEEHMRERAGESPVPRQPSATEAEPADTAEAPTTQRRRYARRIRDVMTTDVITIDRMAPYKEIARLLAEHRISGLPVVTSGRHVVGVVSEADLLAAEENHSRKARGEQATHGRHGVHGWRRQAPPPVPVVAGDLMTSPVITIHPDATISSAARVLNTNHVRRLPVVDPDGRLIGIVSRRDLLSIFLRPDNEIIADARLVLDEILLGRAQGAKVSVRNGVVALTGTLRAAEAADADLIQVAVRLLSDIDGVVEVVNQVKLAESAQPG